MMKMDIAVVYYDQKHYTHIIWYMNIGVYFVAWRSGYYHNDEYTKKYNKYKKEDAWVCI